MHKKIVSSLAPGSISCMIPNTSTLPSDPAVLKKIIAEMAAEKESLRKHYEAENELLREQMRKLFDKLFGRKSEVFSAWISILNSFAPTRSSKTGDAQGGEFAKMVNG